MDVGADLQDKSTLQLIFESVKSFFSDWQQLFKVVGISFAVVLIVIVILPLLFVRVGSYKTIPPVGEIFLVWLSTFLSLLFIIRISLSLVDQEKDFVSWMLYARRQLGKVFVYSIIALFIYMVALTLFSFAIILLISIATTIPTPFLGLVVLYLGTIAVAIIFVWYMLKFILVPYALIIDDLPIKKSFQKAFDISKGKKKMLKFIGFSLGIILLSIVSLTGILIVVKILEFVLSFLPVVITRAIVSGVYIFLLSGLGVFYSVSIYVFYRYLCAGSDNEHAQHIVQQMQQGKAIGNGGDYSGGDNG